MVNDRAGRMRTFGIERSEPEVSVPTKQEAEETTLSQAESLTTSAKGEDERMGWGGTFCRGSTTARRRASRYLLTRGKKSGRGNSPQRDDSFSRIAR